MSYKIVKEHPKTFQIRHPDGSEFHIAKEHIGPETQARVRALEKLNVDDLVKMSDGGRAKSKEPADIEPVDRSEYSTESDDEKIGKTLYENLKRQGLTDPYNLSSARDLLAKQYGIPPERMPKLMSDDRLPGNEIALSHLADKGTKVRSETDRAGSLGFPFRQDETSQETGTIQIDPNASPYEQLASLNHEILHHAYSQNMGMRGYERPPQDYVHGPQGSDEQTGLSYDTETGNRVGAMTRKPEGEGFYPGADAAQNPYYNDMTASTPGGSVNSTAHLGGLLPNAALRQASPPNYNGPNVSFEPMRQMSDGGDVDVDVDRSPASDVIRKLDPDTAPEAAQYQHEANAAAVSALQQPQQGTAQPAQAPATQPTTALPAEPTAQDMYGQQMASQTQNLSDQQAINNKLSAQQQAGYSQTDKALQQMQKQQDANRDYFAPLFDKLMKRNEEMSQSIMNQKIDHNRVWQDASTGNKLMAGLGLLLSGIGSGLTGQPNMAAQFIQKNIDRDINQQKMELGKKETLLSENFRALGDMRAAEAATHAQLLSAFQVKSNMIANQNGSAEALAKNQLLNKSIDMQKLQLGMQATTLTVAARGGNMDPSVLVPRLVPAEHQKGVFEEIQNATNSKNAEPGINSAFEQAVKDTSGLGAVTSMVKEPRSIPAFQQSLMQTVSEKEPSVRAAVVEKLLHAMTPTQYDSESDIDKRRAALSLYMSSKRAAPIAKGFGIDISKFNQSAPPSSALKRIDPKTGKTWLYDPTTLKPLPNQ